MNVGSEYKEYVTVSALMKRDGRMLPAAVHWADGRVYRIDKVREITQAPALRAGGRGDRFTVMIDGRERALFYERSPGKTGDIGRWFVEKKHR